MFVDVRRPTPFQRALLCRRVREEGWSAARAAEAAGCSERTAYRWLARDRAGDTMLDRSSAPHRIANRTSEETVAPIERLRRLRMTSTRIAVELDLATSTVCAVLVRLGLNRLSKLEPPEPPNRYCRRHPGELIHVDVKKLGRFDRPGHRVTGRHPNLGASRRVGWEFVHVAVDDTSRLAYVEVLTDERGETAVGFLARGCVVRRPWRDRATRHERQRLALHLEALGSMVWRPLDPPYPDSVPPAPHQWQGRAIHPDPAPRVGIRSELPVLRPPADRTRILDRLLQPATTTRRPRSPATPHRLEPTEQRP